MTGTYGRVAALVVLGLIAAALVPVFKAVAEREDASVLGAQQILTERGASASWMDGSYRFEIIEQTIAGSDGEPVELRGYAVAWKASCDAGRCTPTVTWRGDLTVEGSERSVVTFDALGRAAAFSGTLYEEGTGTACRFDVQWAGSAQAPALVTGLGAGSFEGTDRVAVTGEPRTLRRVDRANVAAPACWPTPYNQKEFTSGSGSVFTTGA